MTNQINSQPTLFSTSAEALPAPFSLIGELAQRTGVSPMAIRFYEREGLLSPNRVGRFRTYGSEDERRLRSILRLRRIGLPIAKIRKALDVFETSVSPLCNEVATKLLEEHFAELCQKRNDIARQIGHTADYLKELGVAVDGAAASLGSNGSVAADSLGAKSALPEE